MDRPDGAGAQTRYLKNDKKIKKMFRNQRTLGEFIGFQ